MSAASRAEQIEELASGFRSYLVNQTAIELLDAEAAGSNRGSDGLLAAFERLDAALTQIIDLASVYGDNPQLSLDPLTLPAAALVGEYLRHGAGASWIEPDPDAPPGDDALIIAMPDGIAVDLFGVARAALLSGAPNLSAIAASLTNSSDQSETSS